MEIFEKEFEDFFFSCKDYFDFCNHIGVFLCKCKNSKLIKDYTYSIQGNIFNPPKPSIYAISIAAITRDDKLFHSLKTFAVD